MGDRLWTQEPPEGLEVFLGLANPARGIIDQGSLRGERHRGSANHVAMPEVPIQSG